MKIILGSASPRRKELLHMVYDNFEIMTAAGEERAEFQTPSQYVEALALQKAEQVIADNSFDHTEEYLILSADTIVYQSGKVLGKPKSVEDAYQMLSDLSGCTHEVYTGMCITYLCQGKIKKQTCFHDMTKVSVMKLSDTEINSYIASKDPFDKAGGYGIQGLFGKYITGIDGDYYNVVGLPVNKLYRELKTFL